MAVTQFVIQAKYDQAYGFFDGTNNITTKGSAQTYNSMVDAMAEYRTLRAAARVARVAQAAHVLYPIQPVRLGHA